MPHTTAGALLHGKRVRLRPLEEADAPAVAAIQSSTTLLRALDVVPAVPRSAAQIAAWAQALRAASDGFLFAIETLRDAADGGPEVIGWVELDGVLWSAGTTSFSIAIGEVWQGCGYGREALALLFDFVFDELNLHRIGLTVFASNARAIRLYEHLGFVHEGTAREFFQRDGQRHDMHHYGLLRREWGVARARLRGAEPSAVTDEG